MDIACTCISYPVIPSTESSIGNTCILFPYFTSGNAVTLLTEGEWKNYKHAHTTIHGNTV